MLRNFIVVSLLSSLASVLLGRRIPVALASHIRALSIRRMRNRRFDTKFRKGLFFSSGLLAQLLVLLPQFGSQILAEIGRLEHRTNLHLNPAIERSPLQPFHRFLDRPNLPQPVAGNEFLALGEWTINHSALLAR